MRNSTKLKNLLQLYVISLDMDDDELFHFTLNNKRGRSSVTFVDKAYTTVLEKAFSHMKKELKQQSKELR